MEQYDESDSNPQSVAIAAVDTTMANPRDEEKTRFAGLYREDVVQSASQPGLLGLVAKVAGDSDSDSSDSDNEDDKGADAEALTQGCARICWANSEESSHKIEDIRVVDRSFLHGDIVAMVSSPMGQTGTVVNVDLRVDLQLLNGEIITDVDSRTIGRVRPFVIGDYVIHDHWLGRVDELVDNVTVMFEDGAKCKVSRAEPDRLVPVPVSHMDDSECPYYPGQRVRASFSGLFKTARWLKGCWKPNRMEGTVMDVEVDSVMVYWMAAAHTGHTPQAPGVPAERQGPKNIKRLMNFSHATWQLGDRALLPQRLARKGPMAFSVSTEADVHSDCEAEIAESAGQAQGSESVEVGRSLPLGSKDSAVDSWVAYRRKLKRRFTKHKKKVSKKEDFVETALLIVGTKTKVDVLWQDGTRARGVDACTLFPVDHLGDHDFWPEQHVMERGSGFEGSDLEISKRVGIVKSVDSKQRTARVRWLSPTSHPQKWPCFESEETVSVYELIEHPDYDYCLGDVVIRLCPTVDPPKAIKTVNVSEEFNAVTSRVSECEQEHGSELCTTVEDTAGTEANSKAAGEPNPTDLSWVGVITGIQDGQIEVAWADGVVSKVGSQAIFVVGRDEDDGSSQASAIETGEEVDDAGSWTTVDSTEMNDVEEGEQELGQSDWGDSAVCEGLNEVDEHVGLMNEEGQGSMKQEQTNEAVQSEGVVAHGLGSALSFPFSALIRALKFAASLLWALRGSKRNLGPGHSSVAQSQVVQNDEASSGPEELSDSSKILEKDVTMQPIDGSSAVASSIVDYATTPPEGEARSGDIISLEEVEKSVGPEEGGNEAAQECLSPKMLAVDNRAASDLEWKKVEVSDLFKQFDSVKDSTDHHFNNEAGQPSNQRRWSKKIQQEWAMLEKCLPDTIYVRVYEDRMDLMRSVIAGATGTPYHDGLFFFDLYLPSEYPTVPPLVHYHSGGLRLNPNLYETGKVCLSLLNTWTGKGNEIWHPSTSSILQVLVSIQGLVLNANPYFNEAGYGKQIGTAEGEKNSLAYVENSFLLSCKSMLYLIRRPPKHFEDFVREHFKRRGPYILQACLSYMQGSPVGSLLDDGMVSPSYGKDLEQSTTGFRLMLAKIIPRLIAAFKEVGANCEPYEQLNAEKS